MVHGTHVDHSTREDCYNKYLRSHALLFLLFYPIILSAPAAQVLPNEFE